MADILSNEEIDTLLAMFRAGGGANDDEAAPAGTSAPPVTDESVREVDLLKPNRLSRDHMRGLERFFENAAKTISATIADKLRLETRCDCVAVEQMRFGTWLEQLPGPAAIYVTKMEPFRQPVLFTASTSLLYGAVDRILGGSGKVSRVPKDFTAAEYTVADALVGPCLDRIVEALKDVVPLKWTIENRFCNPSMAQILPSQDVVLSIYFQASGNFLLGDMRLMIPFVSLEPLLEKLGKDTVTRLDPGAMQTTVANTVRKVPLDIGVELGSGRIRLKQLLDLEPGDVVPLDARLGAPASISVQGRPKFLGNIGKVGNRFAFQVADVMGKP
ncbi:flagellar motor switch protein FliM [Planctomycetota bacterium]|nr:flagellar motor switch protein FliM [Planctomycetota bacterium]